MFLDKFSNKLCESILPSNLKMQTNMHLRLPGGELPRALSLGLLQTCPRSSMNQRAESESVPRSKASVWHQQQTLLGASFTVPPAATVLNPDPQTQQPGDWVPSWGLGSHVGMQE